MPERFTWSFNTMHRDLLSMMKKFEELPDDGELKMFSFGVHAKDFETSDMWGDLQVFADTYGHRNAEFFYGTVDDIFAQEDAIKSATVEGDVVVNNSYTTEIYFKVNDKKVKLTPRSSYNTETGEIYAI